MRAVWRLWLLRKRTPGLFERSRPRSYDHGPLWLNSGPGTCLSGSTTTQSQHPETAGRPRELAGWGVGWVTFRIKKGHSRQNRHRLADPKKHDCRDPDLYKGDLSVSFPQSDVLDLTPWGSMGCLAKHYGSPLYSAGSPEKRSHYSFIRFIIVCTERHKMCNYTFQKQRVLANTLQTL